MFVTPSTGCSQCTPCPKEVTASAAVTKEESAEFSNVVIWCFWCPDAALVGCSVGVTHWCSHRSHMRSVPFVLGNSAHVLKVLPMNNFY